MRVLAIDTSSARSTAGTVLLAADGAVTEAHERHADDGRAHGELLAGLVADALAAAGFAPHDLDAVVVGAGPGPYTGLRVGIVTAATMAALLDVPLYGVVSLDAIAAVCTDRPLLVVTDARRKEVYWARYDVAGSSGPQVDRPATVDRAGVTVAGAGAALHPDVFGAGVGSGHPDVRGLVQCAADRLLGGAPTEVVEPLYLRRPDAVEPTGRKSTVQR